MQLSDTSLRILAGWVDTFSGRVEAGRWQGGEADAAGVIQVPWFDISDVLLRFTRDMAEAGLVRPVDWMRWVPTPRAQRLIRDPAEIAGATHDEIVYLVTTIIRGERFSDGEIAAALERGTLLALARRAAALLRGGA